MVSFNPQRPGGSPFKAFFLTWIESWFPIIPPLLRFSLGCFHPNPALQRLPPHVKPISLSKVIHLKKKSLSSLGLLSSRVLSQNRQPKSFSLFSSPSRSYHLKTFQLLDHQASGLFLGFNQRLPLARALSRLEFFTACRISPI